MQSLVDAEDESLSQARDALDAAVRPYAGRQYRDERDARKAAALLLLMLGKGTRGLVTLAHERAALEGQRFAGVQLDALLPSVRPAVAQAARATVAADPIAEARAALAGIQQGGAYRTAAAATDIPQAAKAYTETLREKLNEALARREGRGARLGEAFKDAVRGSDSKLEQVIATESSKAFSQAHDEAVQRLVQAAPEVAAQFLLRWDATLDSRTCPRCEELDGTTARLDEGFNPAPGEIHPRCRCVPTIIPLH